MCRVHRRAIVQASTVLILLLAVMVSALVSVGAWYLLVQRNAAAREEETRQRLLGAIGLSRPVSNKLDTRFADTDGDLVADAPAADKQIDPPTLKFSYVAVDEDVEAFKAAWSDFIKHLSNVTGKPVEYLVLDSEQEQLRAMRDGKLHVTGFNTGRVPIAVNACGFVPVAVLGDEKGNGKTHTEIIVPASSKAQSISDLKGHELALTDTGSNSGYKAPLVFLKDHGLLPERDFTLRYSGSHDASIRGIVSGQYQAAAVAADVLQRAIAADVIKPQQYRVLFKSENFPTAGMGYVNNLRPELAKKVADALLNFDVKGTSIEGFLVASGQSKLVPANYKDDWSLVRRIDDAIGYEHVVK
jgi:phosphonate transport system substrate-binding protein